ncbi:MAG: hypothetical protein ACLQVY_13935 [Limisphaerales bacterium]
MLKEAEHVRLVWKLKRVPPLTTSNVTFDAVAKPFGVSGEIGTMDHLFRWDFEYNALRAFVDAQYTPQSFSSRSVGGALAKQIPLGKKKSILTAKQAEELARWYLHALGLTEKQLRLSEPPRVRQYLYFDEGIEHPLPLFEVAWILSGASEIGPGVTFDISGVTGEVAQYYNTATQPGTALPTNYMDMLEILPPTNMHQKVGLGLWPHKPQSLATNAQSPGMDERR